MNAANGNGNGKLSSWLIGLLTTIGLGIAGGTIRSVQNGGERIAVLESQIKDTREDLRSIIQKLDKLLLAAKPFGVSSPLKKGTVPLAGPRTSNKMKPAKGRGPFFNGLPGAQAGKPAINTGMHFGSGQGGFL